MEFCSPCKQPEKDGLVTTLLCPENLQRGVFAAELALRDFFPSEAAAGSDDAHPVFLREPDGVDLLVLENYDERIVTLRAGNIGGAKSGVNPDVGMQNEIRFTHLIEHAGA
jgi:hypothetical protein